MSGYIIIIIIYEVYQFMKKNAYLIIAAIAINNFGDIIFDLFIAWKLSAFPGKFMNAVYIIGTSVAFRAMLAFAVGNIIDRYSKKKLMIISHISSIITIALLGICWQIAETYITVGIIFVLINDVNNEIFARSYISMTADMFNENTYIKFQSYSIIAVRIVVIGGSALAGFLIENLSVYVLFFIDIVTYLLSLVLIINIAFTENNYKNKLKKNAAKKIVSDIKYTFSYIFHSSFLLSFVLLMFILNLAYGYIPRILPLLKANMHNSAALFGMIKSALTIGEIIGLLIVSKASRFVSLTFKISMAANIVILMGISFIQNVYVIMILFALYGISDSLTQPLFGYTVSQLDSKNRGKLLGGIDMIIMFSPSIGIYFISALSHYSMIIGGIVIALLFCIGLLIVSCNKNMNHIILE